MIELRPSDIFYSQDSISNRFKCRERFIGETLDKLLSGTIEIHNIPTIKVVLKNGQYYSEDNRRLWVFKKAEELGYLETVKVNKTSYYNYRKFTTTNGGRGVRIRGGDPGGSIWKDWNPNKYRTNKSPFGVQSSCDSTNSVRMRSEEQDDSNLQSGKSNNSEFGVLSRLSKSSLRVQGPNERSRRILTQKEREIMINYPYKELMRVTTSRDVEESVKENGSQRVGYYNSHAKSSYSTYMQSYIPVENRFRAEESSLSQEKINRSSSSIARQNNTCLMQNTEQKKQDTLNYNSDKGKITRLQECSNTQQVFVGCDCGIECRMLNIGETRPCNLWTSRLREVEIENCY